MSASARYLAGKMLGDAYFVYVAFAPVARNTKDLLERTNPEHVMVKVGISAVPMKRLAGVHLNCPFRVASAAFVAVGRKKAALRAESRILEYFKEYRTRGEWLMLPSTEAMKAEFALRSKAIIQDTTGRPVSWTRVSGSQLAAQLMAKIEARSRATAPKCQAVDGY